MATKKISPRASDASSKSWKEFSSWINGKDVRGGPESQKKAAQLRAEKLRKQFAPKVSSEDRRSGGAKKKSNFSNNTGAQTRRAPGRRIPGTK